MINVVSTEGNWVNPFNQSSPKEKFNMQQPSFIKPAPRLLSLTVATVATSLLNSVVYAQGIGPSQAMALEEVVVTAQRRQENLRDVPISVVALSAAALEQRGVTGTISLPEAVPSVQFTSSGPAGVFFVRGVGNTNAGIGEEGANAFYVDGVFMPDLIQSVLKFNNVDRIEVLKGPQGTLFGRNSSGGLVHVITREPTQETEASIKLGYESYDKSTIQAYLSGGLTENVAADIAITTANQADGWGKNIHTGSDVGKGWHWGIRSKAVWTPTDAAKFTFAGEYMKLSDNTANLWHLPPGSRGWSQAYSPEDLANPSTWEPGRDRAGSGYDIEHDFSRPSRIRLWGGSMTADIDLGWATFTSISSVRKLTNESSVDVDASSLSLLHLDMEADTRTYQQEFRLASNESEPFSWQAGLFYLNSDVDLAPQFTWGRVIDASTGLPQSTLVEAVGQKTESWALFGEISYAFTPATRATLGLRYTRDEIKLDASQKLASPFLPHGEIATLARKETASDKEPTWRLAIHHDLTDNVNVYASYNRGFKSGLYALNSSPWRRVEPQTIDAFEVGAKAEFFDNRLRLNTAAFHYEIDNYQIRAVLNAGQQTLLNAAEVEVNGVEVELEALLFSGVTVFGSATWLKSEFADFANAPSFDSSAPPSSVIGGGELREINAKGNKTPLAPKFAGNIGASYSILMDNGGEVRLTGLYSYNGGYYFESDNRLEQDSYGIINASIGYHPTPQLGIVLWSRNLSDKRYYVQQNGQSIGDYAVLAAPRTYGIEVSLSY